MADFCENCKYRDFIAKAYDMHIDSNDCDKVNTFFCEKMRKQETVVIIDAGCTDKTMYHKGFKDGYESVDLSNRYTAHEVAEILTDLFGDACACNFNCIDEWLPEKCELLDACPNVVGVACWEQYLKHGERKDNDRT